MSSEVRTRPIVGRVASVWKVAGRVLIAAQVCVMQEVWRVLSTESTRHATPGQSAARSGESSETSRKVLSGFVRCMDSKLRVRCSRNSGAYQAE